MVDRYLRLLEPMDVQFRSMNHPTESNQKQPPLKAETSCRGYQSINMKNK